MEETQSVIGETYLNAWQDLERWLENRGDTRILRKLDKIELTRLNEKVTELNS